MPPRWHRVRSVREREQIPLRRVSRWTKLKVSALKALEDESQDLRVSTLYTWARLLDVPVSELLREPEGTLSEPIRQRACLLRIAKTAYSLLEKSQDSASRRLAQNLVDQLTELMPELANVSPWPEEGSRRAPRSAPRIFSRVLPAAGVPTEFSEQWSDSSYVHDM